MTRFNTAFVYCLLAVLSVLALPVHAQELSAREVVETTTSKVLSLIQANNGEIQNDSGEMMALLDEHLVPHLDVSRMGRWVLGKYWRKATAEQQQQFVQQFTVLLMRTYGTALSEYSGQGVNYLPSRPGMQPGRSEVRTLVSQPGGFPIPINYSMAYSQDGGWKVIDIVVDGISLITNYRSSFSRQIRNSGVDGLIAVLAERNSGLTQ